MNILLTFDVEKDLHSNGFESLNMGIPRLLKILDKHNIKVTFFVSAKLIEGFPDYFRNLRKQGHEIELHGYDHERFDELSIKEKEVMIKKSIEIYKKVLKENPLGFRAPQMSINNETLKLLKKYNFLYDSSYMPLDIYQLIFFPKKIKLWSENFLKPRKIYTLDKDFYEAPVSSCIIPFASMTLRFLAPIFLKIYLKLLKFVNKNPTFIAHSWDFIEIPQSRVDRIFSHNKFMKRLELAIQILSKNGKFITIKQLVYETQRK